jgi:hypothetical protein
MRALPLASLLLVAGACFVACGTSTDTPRAAASDADASAPTPAHSPVPRSAYFPGHSPTLDRENAAVRARIFDGMEHQGAVASGLHPMFDPDFAGPGAPPLPESLDVTVNGLTEQATQSETSIAINAAGTILVAGFNDATGFPAPAEADQNTLSLSGVARSTNGGTTWSFITGGPTRSPSTLPTVTSGSVFGDPDVKYDATRDRFYYASIYVRPSDRLQGMSIHESDTGANAGLNWSAPREVGPTFIANHSADKEFIDINARTGRLLLSWTDFGTANVSIRSTYSDDGGVTWSTATTLDSTVTNMVQASVPRFLPAATNATSSAYVVYRNGTTTTRNIGCVRSTDGGATFSARVNLDASDYPVEDQILGVDRIATSPSMAIDAVSGRVYVVYQRNNAEGTGDIAVRSFVGACAAATPVILSANPGSDRAQFMPWVTVDASNQDVHVLWYDQGHHATGDVIEVLHTVSHDQGTTWSRPTPLVDRPFHAGFGNDTGQPNMGDYIQGVAQNGVLHTVWGGTSLEPQFSEGLPSGSLICPDVYYDDQQGGTGAPLRLVGTTIAESRCVSGANGKADPGETLDLTVNLQNYVVSATVGATTLTNVTGALSTSTAGVTVTTASAAWSNVAAGATGANLTPLGFKLDPGFVAGTPIDFTLAVASAQGNATIPVRIGTGTDGTPTNALSENFESVTVPALPSGWTSNVGGGTNVAWVTSSTFSPMTTKFAFHTESTGTRFMRLWSPVVAVPAPAGASAVTLDFDLAYRLEDEPTQKVAAFDGLTVRVTDQTGGTPLRSVLAEAFAQQFTTGSSDHFPKHLPRSSDAAYFQDMSVWSGDSGGVQHVRMRFPGAGMVGRSVQLRFEYTEDTAGTCTDNGYAAPCGVGVDNVVLSVVPLTDGHCVLPVCGNAVPEVGEQCDHGVLNGQAGDCCSAGCTFQAATVVCRPSAGACDVAETCNGAGSCPADGKANNGTACDDSNGCTQTDTCQSGVCTGANPVTCAPLDQCHDVGTCSPATGQCSNPAKGDGASCNDGNACTRTDSCQAGACTGANPVSCTAQDDCHVAGTCDTSSGLCSNPAKADGAGCNDGDPCTKTDVCTAGVCAGAAVTCSASDECHTAGSCVADAGTCTNPAKADGTPCAIGTCQAGQCTAPPDAGPGDAGATGNDAGTTGNDAGATADAGAGGDSGSGTADASSGSADADIDGGPPVPVPDSGCGCRTVGTKLQSGRALTLSVVALPLLLVARRRRRRSAGA